MFNKSMSQKLKVIKLLIYRVKVLLKESLFCWWSCRIFNSYPWKHINKNEFLYDFLKNHKGLLNIGVSSDISIRELAKLVSSIIGFKREINSDWSKPFGTPRK